jgi:hypothetical protein
MGKRAKCSDGFFCINIYFAAIIILISIIVYLIYCNYDFPRFLSFSSLHNDVSVPTVSGYSHYHNNLPPHSHLFNLPSQRQSGYDLVRPLINPSVSYSDHPKDTLMNPYSPPLRYNEPHAYKQIGYLKNSDYSTKMFPIFAKPLHLRRDKWYYYTIYDNIKLPIYNSSGRKCSSEHGCDSLMNGDSVNLENISEPFVVYLYDNHGLVYEPVI